MNDEKPLDKFEKQFRNFFDKLHQTHSMQLFEQCLEACCTILKSIEIPSELKDRYFLHMIMLVNTSVKDAIFSSEEDITEITTRVRQKFDHLNEKRKK